jgi:3-hydroxyisobutyrate dehydrogenase-like beta-hydroxyacid dehydrogenase
MSTTIAFIGFGEVGQLFARELAGKPGVDIAVHDILFDDLGRGRRLRRKATEIGVRAVDSVRELCRNSAIVISAVTADSAVAAARQAGPHHSHTQV